MQWTYGNNYGKQSQCNATGETESEMAKKVPSVQAWADTLFDLNNKPIYQVFVLGDETRKIQSQIAINSGVEYVKNEGYYNKCRTDREAGVGNYCLNGVVVAHGSQIKESIDNTLNIPNEQLIAADEIGELIDSLMQGLEQFAFQNIDGLLGLAGDEGGSYVDELSGNGASSGATDSLQGILATDISGSLETERAYYELLTLLITDLESAKASYAEVRACYEPLTTTGKGAITPAAARDIVDLASSTITTALTPQLNDLYIERSNSETSMAELENLLDAAQSAFTLEDSLTASHSFTAL
jgi:hypothetical protein